MEERGSTGSGLPAHRTVRSGLSRRVGRGGAPAAESSHTGILVRILAHRATPSPRDGDRQKAAAMAQIPGRSSANPSLARLCANCLVVARLVAGYRHFVLPIVTERSGESARDADATSCGQRVWLKTLRREILGTDDLYDHPVSCPAASNSRDRRDSPRAWQLLVRTESWFTRVHVCTYARRGAQAEKQTGR